MASENFRDEMFRHMNENIVSSSNLFLRSAILINGGAAVAVLGFVASIAKADQSYADVILGVSGAIVLFAYGAAAGVFSMGMAYFTNYATLATFNNRGGKRERFYAALKRLIHCLSLVAAAATVALFVLGTLAVKAAITSGIV